MMSASVSKEIQWVKETIVSLRNQKLPDLNLAYLAKWRIHRLGEQINIRQREVLIHLSQDLEEIIDF